MKKRIIILIIAVIIATFTLTGSIISALPAQNTANGKIDDSYKLVAYGDNIALIHNGEVSEIYYEIVLNSLPEYDRQRFIEGVELENLEELEKILQDYEG